MDSKSKSKGNYVGPNDTKTRELDFGWFKVPPQDDTKTPVLKEGAAEAGPDTPLPQDNAATPCPAVETEDNQQRPPTGQANSAATPCPYQQRPPSGQATSATYTDPTKGHYQRPPSRQPIPGPFSKTDGNQQRPFGGTAEETARAIDRINKDNMIVDWPLSNVGMQQVKICNPVSEAETRPESTTTNTRAFTTPLPPLHWQGYGPDTNRPTYSTWKEHCRRSNLCSSNSNNPNTNNNNNSNRINDDSHQLLIKSKYSSNNLIAFEDNDSQGSSRSSLHYDYDDDSNNNNNTVDGVCQLCHGIDLTDCMTDKLIDNSWRELQTLESDIKDMFTLDQTTSNSDFTKAIKLCDYLGDCRQNAYTHKQGKQTVTMEDKSYQRGDTGRRPSRVIDKIKRSIRWPWWRKTKRDPADFTYNKLCYE